MCLVRSEGDRCPFGSPRADFVREKQGGVRLRILKSREKKEEDRRNKGREKGRKEKKQAHILETQIRQISDSSGSTTGTKEPRSASEAETTMSFDLTPSNHRSGQAGGYILGRKSNLSTPRPLSARLSRIRR